MKNFSMFMMVAAFLSGCGGKVTEVSVPNTAPKADYSDREVAQAARAGHRIDLGVDAFRKGQIDDKDYVEMNAQLHNAVMSSNNATASVKAMREAEEADRINKGLKEAPPKELSKDQQTQILEDIRKKIDDVKERVSKT